MTRSAPVDPTSKVGAGTGWLAGDRVLWFLPCSSGRPAHLCGA